MEEKDVKNLVERIGESIVWGPDQEVSLLRFDNLKGCYVRIEDGEDMVAEIDRQEDAEWVAQKQMSLPMISELTVIGEERRADADEEESHNGAGTVVSIDWNDIDLEERRDLVIAPITDIKMAKLFGIPVDAKDKEKDDTSVPPGANSNSNPQDDADILKHLMEMGAGDVDDANDNELVNLYDKENPVIEVGKLWPNMAEFRMCFKTYAMNHEFEFFMCPPITRRKAGRPKQSRFKAWFERGGSSKKGKKDKDVKPKRAQEVEEVHQVKHAEVLGRAVGRPTGCGKKTRSINKLYVVEVENSKKSSGKKRQKK
ncbi:hypothetical protein D1007_43261 [Hordeum vulgare]|nr:hypothetical protein D1007_43261 [Hordeum vulgare]